ncbi:MULTISPECIES: septum formation family protein [unclassified Microbacterium]|uniref:septum formation family protein n=1 Tax=unclassified Microbacterium TaxID=2609290 RepID=UPI0012FAE2C4|nr:septum formation family protein [Microbacterium sp. MAH-37]
MTRRPTAIPLILGWMVLASVLAGCSPTPAPTPTPTFKVDIDLQSGIYTLQVGDCFTQASLDKNKPDVPCDSPHDGEIYAVLQHKKGKTPSVADFQAEADTACLTSFKTFVGVAYKSSTLRFSYIYPSPETWSAGDRSTLCYVYENGKQTTGSLQGTKR